ncbi:hypothetical protein GSI_05498 [Ganoderma sinense ZZ0214-1]|uniref:Uncharacterized protein n=1 Tax=Ganoderma sinense ZZ0214-1 TaxID=1077348 RepID=A0A2G8SES7_9APHY|nr:hypothetical protein GSI_05498 [Ganoderma sinense ZZ0214-1]
MSQPPSQNHAQHQPQIPPDTATTPVVANGAQPAAPNATIGTAIGMAPPTTTGWNQPPLLPNWAAAMDLDPQNAPRGGGNHTDQQNAALASIMSMFAPTGQPSMFDAPMPPIPFPTLPVAAPTFSPTPPSVGPMDAWRTAYGATMQTQQVLQERVTELSNRNALLEQEANRLRQEIASAHRHMLEQDRASNAREIDLAHREAELAHRQNDLENGRYHPFRRPSPSHSVDGRRNREYRPHGSSPSSLSATSSVGAPSSSTSSQSATPSRGPAPSVTNSTTPAAETRNAAPGPSSSDDVRSDLPSATGSAPAARRDPLVSSEFATLGRPDPSLQNDPLSTWGKWYQTTGSTYETTPTFGDGAAAQADYLPGAELPAYAPLLMGRAAEAKEEDRIRKAKLDAGKGKSVRTPCREDQPAPDCGPWSDVVIETANQAHNLRHAAVVDRDIHAIRFYREFNRAHQDRTERRSEGGRILMRAFPSDSRYLIHESGDNARSRRNARTRTQSDEGEDEDKLDELVGDEIHAAGSIATGPSTSTASPSQPTAAPASTPSMSSNIAPIHRVAPAAIASEAWSARTFAGRQRHLDPLDESLTLVNAFAALPTSEWPIAMRDNNGEFPPRGNDVHRIPLVDDVRAETFLARLLPIVPAGHSERFGESAFFRGLIELFSLRGAYDWLVARGEYTQLLEDPPTPFPFDCTDLALHHVAAWAASHGVDQVPMLRELVTVYAVNTRRRLEGQADSTPITAPFTTAPSRTADVTLDHHTSLIPLHNTLFNGPHCSYGSEASTEDVTMASETTAPETTDT